jgi:hypothetical protein
MRIIEVKQEDIELGKGRGRNYLFKCPIACAILRQFDMLETAYVYTGRIILIYQGEKCEFFIPSPELVKWMRQFDMTHQGEPFSFDLDSLAMEDWKNA